VVGGNAAAEPMRLSMQEAMRLALDSAPATQISQFEIDAAVATRREAIGAFLPAVDLTLRRSTRTFNLEASGFPAPPGSDEVIGPFDGYEARVRVQQPLLDLASWSRLREASHSADATRSDRERTLEEAAQSAALAYLRAARSSATRDARDSDLRLAEEFLSAARDREAAGTVAGIEVTRAETRVTAARSARLSAEHGWDRAQVTLALTLGIDPSSRFELADDLDVTDVTDATEQTATGDAIDGAIGGAVERALVARAELERDEASLRATEARITGIGREGLPALRLSADYGWDGIALDRMHATGQLALELTTPLFDGQRRNSRQERERARLGALQSRQRALRDRIAAEVRSAALDLASANEQADVTEEQLRLAELEVAQARDRFENGISGNLEVIEAQSSRVQAQDARIDARFRVAVARVDLQRALGSLRADLEESVR